MVSNRSSWPLLAGLVLLSACGGGEPTGQDTLNVPSTEDSTAQAERMRKTRNIFYNIPSPMETAALLKKANTAQDERLYDASVNNQTQESMFFTSCAKKLADRLGVSNAFDDATLERMEKNMNNRDSLLSIISETYWTVDAYLKENERDNISALMIAGGWVEGLYIATQVSRVKATPGWDRK